MQGIFTKRPLILVALLYVAGILLARLPAPLTVLFALSFVLLLVAFAWARGRPVLLCLLILLAGWINLNRCTTVLSPNDLRTLVREKDNLVVVRGVLPETPQRRTRREKDKEIQTTTAQLEVSAIQINNEGWQPAVGRMVTTTKGLLPENFFAGQTVEIIGVLGPPKRPVAEGLFDYPAYLKHLGIYHHLQVRETAHWEILSSPARPPFTDRFCDWSRKTLARGLPVEDETLRLEWALTLGWKAALTEEVSEPFIRAATYHIFAVDGLRIAIISGILIGLLRVLGVPRAFCGVVAVPLILFYAALTGWPASAVRAIVMVMVVFGGWVLRRPRDLINSLAAAALVILVWEPRQLFQAGFQLSFFVVLCIVLILPFFEELGKKLFRMEPWLPDELRPRWQARLKASTRLVVELFLTSVAAWLGSIPLVVYYFHLITPASGPANVFAVPLCGLVLICNLSSLLLGAWFPWASELFNHAGWLMMKGIQVTSQWSADWPGAYFYLPMPSLFTLGLYYLILLTLLTGWLFQGDWRRWKIAGLALLTAAWCVQWVHQRPVTQLTVLPLNGGHAVHVRSPGWGNEWLIDCGDDSSVETIVKPFLRAQGVNRLPNFILTHGSASYTAGAESTFKLFRPEHIYTSPVQFRSPSYKEFQRSDRLKLEWKEPLQRGKCLGPWTVLQPDAEDHFSRGEDIALVLRGEIDGTVILLLADPGRPGQRALLDRTNNLRSDIVVAGIPSEGEPLSDTLLEAIQPKVIIVADATYPATKQAKAGLKTRLGHRTVPVLYESSSGAVTLEVRPGRWNLRAMDGTQFSGRGSGNQ